MAARIRAALVAVVVVAAISACTATPSGQPSAATSRSSFSSPTAPTSVTSATDSVVETPAASTPSPTVTAAAVVTTAGYGDLKIGKPVPVGSSLVHWVANWCYPDGNVPKDYVGDNGRWIPNGYTGTSTDFSKVPDFFVTTGSGSGSNKKESPVNWILISSPNITTKSGAHVGMTAAEIEKLFPKAAVSASTNPDITLYTVRDAVGEVVFDAGADTDGGTQVVQFIHVLPRSTKPFSLQYGEYPNCFS